MKIAAGIAVAALAGQAVATWGHFSSDMDACGLQCKPWDLKCTSFPLTESHSDIDGDNNADFIVMLT